MTKKPKQIDTSAEHMQELLARCPERVAKGLLACIEAQFVNPDSAYQSAKLEAIASNVAQAQSEKTRKAPQIPPRAPSKSGDNAHLAATNFCLGSEL